MEGIDLNAEIKKLNTGLDIALDLEAELMESRRDLAFEVLGKPSASVEEWDDNNLALISEAIEKTKYAGLLKEMLNLVTATGFLVGFEAGMVGAKPGLVDIINKIYHVDWDTNILWRQDSEDNIKIKYMEHGENRSAETILPWLCEVIAKKKSYVTQKGALDWIRDSLKNGKAVGFYITTGKKHKVKGFAKNLRQILESEIPDCYMMHGDIYVKMLPTIKATSLSFYEESGILPMSSVMQDLAALYSQMPEEQRDDNFKFREFIQYCTEQGRQDLADELYNVLSRKFGSVLYDSIAEGDYKQAETIVDLLGVNSKTLAAEAKRALGKKKRTDADYNMASQIYKFMLHLDPEDIRASLGLDYIKKTLELKSNSASESAGKHVRVVDLSKITNID